MSTSTTAKRALIYARVSTEDQVEKYGLPVQLRVCREFIAQQGWMVTEEIADEGVSGDTLDRPGLKRICALARNREIDVLVMVDVDRLSRNMRHLLNLKADLEETVALHFVNAAFEDSPSGQLFFQIRGSVGEYERKLIRQRTMRGQRERVVSGLMVGGRVPYGYTYEPGSQRRYSGRLLVDESKAAIVREIFAWHAAGVSVREIAARLNERALPTWGGKPWGHTSVRWILGSATYTGAFHWKAKSGMVAIPVPAIVEQSLFDAVRLRLAENRDLFHGRPSRMFLLSGLASCQCGRRLYAEAGRGRRYPHYRCAGRDRESGFACRKAVNGGELDRVVWAEVVRLFSDPALLESRLRACEALIRENATEHRAEELREQVSRLRRREASALDLLLDAEFSSPELKARYRGLQLERTRAEQELRRMEEQERSAKGLAGWLRSKVDLLREDIQHLTELSERRELLKGLQTRVKVNGMDVEIRCFVVPEMSNMPQRIEHFRALEVVLNTRLAA